MIETRYINLSEEIEKRIKAGHWKDRLPGVLRLSMELNAGPATVSKAFKILAEKGIVTIDGKKGTFITQPGKGVKHKVIGVIGINSEHPSCFEELSAMEKTAEASGYRVMGIAHKNDLFINDLSLFLKLPVDGYIFMYSSLTFEIAAFLRQNGIPFVSCNRPVGIPGVNWVDFDSEASLEKVMHYLIALGHERIAYIEFYNPNYDYTERILNTYRKVLSENGISFDKSLFISNDQYRYYNTYGEDYLRAHGADCANNIMKLKEKPTAVLITDANTTYGFTEELKKHDLNVPDDISIITYNSKNIKDDFFTTLFNDYKKRSEMAVNILSDLIDTPYMEMKEKLIEGKIIINKSCSEVEGKRK